MNEVDMRRNTKTMVLYDTILPMSRMQESRNCKNVKQRAFLSSFEKAKQRTLIKTVQLLQLAVFEDASAAPHTSLMT